MTFYDLLQFHTYVFDWFLLAFTYSQLFPRSSGQAHMHCGYLVTSHLHLFRGEVSVTNRQGTIWIWWFLCQRIWNDVRLNKGIWKFGYVWIARTLKLAFDQRAWRPFRRPAACTSRGLCRGQHHCRRQILHTAMQCDLASHCWANLVTNFTDCFCRKHAVQYRSVQHGKVYLYLSSRVPLIAHGTTESGYKPSVASMVSRLWFAEALRLTLTHFQTQSHKCNSVTVHVCSLLTSETGMCIGKTVCFQRWVKLNWNWSFAAHSVYFYV